jgi:hypothetical protein
LSLGFVQRTELAKYCFCPALALSKGLLARDRQVAQLPNKNLICEIV